MQNYRPAWLHYLQDIDNKSYDYPWSEEGWKDIKDQIIRVYISHRVPRAFYLFRELRDNIIFVSKLCVIPKWRGMGLGNVLHDDLLKQTKRKKLITNVYEKDLKAMGWLNKCGWRATTIEKNLYPDGCDSYVFERVS
jgi:GNAT superfamily N-acetyltransferase